MEDIEHHHNSTPLNRLSAYFRNTWFADLQGKGDDAVMLELRRITDRVVQKYLTKSAIADTPRNQEKGDDAQYVFCLTLRDLIHYHEACCATSNGETKRVYQVILVRLSY